MENKITDLVSLEWSLNKDDTAGIIQVSPESQQIFLQPAQKRLVTITFSSIKMTQPKVDSLLKLLAKNEASKEQVLLDGKRAVLLHGTKEKATGPTLTVSSYSIDEEEKGKT